MYSCQNFSHLNLTFPLKKKKKASLAYPQICHFSLPQNLFFSVVYTKSLVLFVRSGCVKMKRGVVQVK